MSIAMSREQSELWLYLFFFVSNRPTPNLRLARHNFHSYQRDIFSLSPNHVIPRLRSQST